MRHIRRWIRLLIIANLLLVGSLAAVIALDLVEASGGQATAPAAVASASPALVSMGLAHIPTTSACVVCHASGGEVKVVPAVLHPIEGWRRCIVCHTNQTIGRDAPGHEGIAEEECLNCHKVSEGGPAITRPHAELQDQRCLTCHGGVAHLPTSMATSKESDCVLCHKPAPLAPPAYPHAANAPLQCRTCHQSPEVGGLPIDHALRADGTCLLCHSLKYTAGATTSPVPSR
jgi:hypothetical protein